MAKAKYDINTLKTVLAENSHSLTKTARVLGVSVPSVHQRVHGTPELKTAFLAAKLTRKGVR